jgi:hypothetical protein
VQRFFGSLCSRYYHKQAKDEKMKTEQHIAKYIRKIAELRNPSTVVDIAWIAIKIIWAVYCLWYSFLGIRVIGDELMNHFPVCFVFFFWFAAGFLFCVLQHKIQNLSWAIVIHLFLTSLFVAPSSPFYPYLFRLYTFWLYAPIGGD